MKRQINRKQKGDISFRLSYILLLVNSLIFYGMLAEYSERYNAVHSVGDCREWICTEINTNQEGQTVSSQLQAIEKIDGVKQVLTIGLGYSYSEQKPECGLMFYTYDPALFEILQYEVSEGRLPQAEHEIALTVSAKKYYALNEKVTVSALESNVTGTGADTGNIREETYTVVGFLAQDDLLVGEDYVELDTRDQYLMLFRSTYEKTSDFIHFGAIALQTEYRPSMECGEVAFVQCNSEADLTQVAVNLRNMGRGCFALQDVKDVSRKSPLPFLVDGSTLIREIIFFCGLCFLLAAVFLGDWERTVIIKRGVMIMLAPLVIPIREGWSIMIGGSAIMRLQILWLAGIGLLYLFFYGLFIGARFLYQRER